MWTLSLRISNKMCRVGRFAPSFIFYLEYFKSLFLYYCPSFDSIYWFSSSKPIEKSFIRFQRPQTFVSNSCGLPCIQRSTSTPSAWEGIFRILVGLFYLYVTQKRVINILRPLYVVRRLAVFRINRDTSTVPLFGGFIFSFFASRRFESFMYTGCGGSKYYYLTTLPYLFELIDLLRVKFSLMEYFNLLTVHPFHIVQRAKWDESSLQSPSWHLCVPPFGSP